MSRDIITVEDGQPFSVNTFWMGDQEGVQITWNTEHGYVQLTRLHAIALFEDIAKALREQVKQDKKDPPWWQSINQKGGREDDS